MVKFEGMAGLKLAFIIKQLKDELVANGVRVSEDIIKRAFVEVVFECTDYCVLFDKIVEYITEYYEQE